MESYEQLLEKAYTEVKVLENSKTRFIIPLIKGFFQGKKTIISNFFTIASHLRRKPEHFLKYITKELAAKATIEGDKLIFNIKIPSKKINPKIEKYVNEFVLCQECHKPDTELIKEKKLTILHCLACGAKHPVREKI